MRPLRLPALALLLLGTAATASAQSLPGPFASGTSWTNPIGTDPTGTQYIINGTQYPIPSDYIGGTSFLNNAGDIVRASRSAAGDCPAASVPGRTPVEVSYLRVEQNPDRLTLLRTVCVPETIATEGYYDGLAAGSPQRIAYLVTRGNISSQQFIEWIDLNSGAHSTSPFPFNPSVEAVQFAPSGTIALIRHGVAATADYDLVDLCPGVLGTDLTPGTSLDDLGAGVTAAVQNVAGGVFDVVLSQGGSPLTTLTGIPDCLASGPAQGPCCLPDATCDLRTEADCLAAGGNWLGAAATCGDCPPPEPTGACCIGQSCVPDAPQSLCENAGGTFNGAGTTCDTCPMPSFTLDLAAPSTISEGGDLTYQITYANTGDAATGVLLQDFVPAGATFVSASHGGTLIGGAVEWQLGDVGAGSGGAVTLTVAVPCGATEVVNNNCTIRAGIVVQSATPMTTTVQGGPTTPLDVTITAQPSATPLLRGDRLGYAIALTNTEPVARPGVNFSLNLGQAVSFDRVVNDGGGTVQVQGVSNLNWSGSLPASGTVTVAFDVLVDACTTRTDTQLNFGNSVLVRDGCGVNLGQPAPPAATPIQLPVTSHLQVLGVSPPQGIFNQTIQAVRAGGIIDVQLVMANNVQSPQPVSGFAVLPPGWIPQSDPPFVAPTDPGATWDAATREVRWSGTLPAGGQATVTFRVQLDLPDECRTLLSFLGSTAGCSDDANAVVQLLLVPAPPTGGQLLALRAFEGIVQHLPQSEDVLCLTPEIYTGMGSGPNGDIWLCGLPNLRINPETLAFDIFDGSDFGGVIFPSRVLGVSNAPFLSDVAVDPRDNTAVFLGFSQGTGAIGAIGRYDADTDTATPLLQSAALLGLRRIDVRSDGLIAAVGGSGVTVIDPADPNGVQVLSDPNMTASVLAFDPNDSLLVLGTVPPRLARVDLDTGVYSVVADLTGLLSAASFPTGLATDGQRVWLSLQSGGGLQIDLTTTPPTIGLQGLGGSADLTYLAGSGPCPDTDGDGFVTLSDLAQVLADYGNPGPAAAGDADGDGDTDMDDLSLVLARFGARC